MDKENNPAGPDAADSAMTDAFMEVLGMNGQDGKSDDARDRSDAGVQVDGQDSDDDDLDFGDMPNGKIRYQKAKQKLEKEMQDKNSLREALARAQGELQALKPKSQSDNSEPDPRERMTETERLLYDQLMEVKGRLGIVDKDRVESKLKIDEEKFFSENPELQKNRDDVTTEILSYLKKHPVLMKLVRDRTMGIGEVHAAMAASKSGGSEPRRSVQNPDTVFSGERRSGSNVQADSGSRRSDRMAKANLILDTRRGTPEANEALKTIEDGITDYFMDVFKK